MCAMFDHVDQLIGFLSSPDSEIQLNSAMIFGNMARNGYQKQIRKPSSMLTACKSRYPLSEANGHRMHTAAYRNDGQ